LRDVFTSKPGVEDFIADETKLALSTFTAKES